MEMWYRHASEPEISEIQLTVELTKVATNSKVVAVIGDNDVTHSLLKNRVTVPLHNDMVPNLLHLRIYKMIEPLDLTKYVLERQLLPL